MPRLAVLCDRFLACHTAIVGSARGRYLRPFRHEAATCVVYDRAAHARRTARRARARLPACDRGPCMHAQTRLPTAVTATSATCRSRSRSASAFSLPRSFSRAMTGFRGERRRPATSPLIVLLPPVAFVVQEFLERSSTPAMSRGRRCSSLRSSSGWRFQLRSRWPLSCSRGRWTRPRARSDERWPLCPSPTFRPFVPVPVRVVAAPRPAGLARGYGERAPPFPR